MDRLESHTSIQRYLDGICEPIKAKSIHDEIRAEMLSHLEEGVAEKMEHSRMSENDAIEEVLAQMGDPLEIGRQLNQAHKPRTEWSVIALVACLLLVGLVITLSLKLALEGGHGEILLERKIMFILAGIAAMIGMYFFDYRRLIKYSGFLYAGTLLFMALPHWQNNQNNVKQLLAIGSLKINTSAIAPYLLIIAVAGMMTRERALLSGDGKEIVKPVFIDSFLFILLPSFLFVITPATAQLVIYLLSVGVLLIVNKRWKILSAGIMGLAILTILPIKYFAQPYNWERLTAFIHPDVMNAGLVTLRSREALQAGGMWGQGFGIVTYRLPSQVSEFTFSYMVYSLGWVFGIAIIMLSLLFLVRIVKMGLKLKHSYARGLVIGLTSVIGIQYGWNLLMNVGWLPSLSMQLPILNWHANTIVELGVVGLMLSAYRQKDRLGSTLSV